MDRKEKKDFNKRVEKSIKAQNECDDPHHEAARLSCEPIPVDDTWRDQIIQGEDRYVTPKTVTVDGDVSGVKHPDGLVEEGGEATILTTTDARSSVLVIDLGHVAMGFVEIGVIAADGASIRSAHSQFERFAGPDGDDIGTPFGTDAHPWSRVDVFEPPGTSTVLESPGKRETRYIVITVDGPGQVEIDFVRLRHTIYPVTYDGYFLSSDALLNRTWYNSAQTGDLATVSEDGSPWMLTVTFDRVLFMGDLHLQAIAGYNQSSDYRMLVRNMLQQFSCIQNPDGSLPAASSHLVTCKPGDPGPPDGWKVPDEGPDPDEVIGFAGPYSIYHDMTIDSWTAVWVAALADYYLYTGDADFVEPLIPVARRAIDFAIGRTNENGLFYEFEDQRSNPDAKVTLVSNWSPGDKATGVDSFSNAILYDALRGLARLEREIAGLPDAAEQLDVRAESLRKAIRDNLWDPGAGAMILNSEDPLRDHTGDANAGNLMFRTLDDEQAEAAMDFLATTLATSHGTTSSEHPDNEYRVANMQGYINAMEALGRVRYGDGEGAVDLIRRWWGHMLKHGPGTGWFSWGNDGSFDSSTFANASWTTALPALSEGILGIRPVAPAFRQWEIAPLPADLEWAQGTVPTPLGGLSSRWKRIDGGFILTVEAPDQSEGDVVVPLDDNPRQIFMDGTVVWQDNAPVGDVTAEQRGDTVVFSGIQGKHTFAWAGVENPESGSGP